jgi:hypothetical protein
MLPFLSDYNRIGGGALLVFRLSAQPDHYQRRKEL